MKTTTKIIAVVATTAALALATAVSAQPGYGPGFGGPGWGGMGPGWGHMGGWGTWAAGAAWARAAWARRLGRHGPRRRAWAGALA